MGKYPDFFITKLKNKKKILIFIDWFLPGYKAGGPIQSCANLIDHLNDDYEFSVVTRDTDYCEKQPYENIKSNQWNLLPNGTRVYYFSSDQLNKKSIQKILTDEQYDSVYLNGIFSFYFTLLPLYLLRKKNTSIIVASRGMLAQSALSIKSHKKRIFLFLSKIVKLFNQVTFHATKKEELEDIRRVFGNKIKIKLAQNLPKKTVSVFFERAKQQGFVKLINVARIAPEKNLKYALEVLKEVKGKVELDIYGPIYNPAYWDECKEVIKALPANVKVNYRDSIESNKIGEKLKEYHYLFMPTTGENFGHIIIESLSSGCPVIISDQTIWCDLESKNVGWDIALSDRNAFIKVIEKAIEITQEGYMSISKSAFSLAKAYVEDQDSIKLSKDLFS